MVVVSNACAWLTDLPICILLNYQSLGTLNAGCLYREYTVSTYTVQSEGLEIWSKIPPGYVLLPIVNKLPHVNCNTVHWRRVVLHLAVC